MTLVVGRVQLEDPDDVEVDGDRVTFTVEPTSADGYELMARRQQLAGLVDNPDEPVIPVVWDQDSSFNGFYRATGVSVGSVEVGLTTGYMPPAQITLERVAGYGLPAFEVMLQSVVRTNGHGITTPNVIVAGTLADASLAIGFFDGRPDLVGLSTFTRDSTIAAVDWTLHYKAAPQALTAYRWSLPAEYYYRDAATIEVEYNYGSNTFFTLVGNQIPPGLMWRISNGMVRLTVAPKTSTGTFEVLNTSGVWELRTVGHYDSGWSRTEIGRWGGYTTGLMPATVLRNSPEQVTIAVPGSGGGEMVYSLQRFARLVTCAWSAPTATQVGVGLGLAHTAAGTNITGGIRATANDPNGNRMVFGVDAAKTTNTAITAVVNTTPATSGTLFIGCELDGSTATTKNTAADLVDQFIGQVSWRQRVIAR